MEREESIIITHWATPRRKTSETGWHIPLSSDFGDKVSVTYSQEADKYFFKSRRGGRV